MPFSISIKGIDEAAKAVDNMAKTIKPNLTTAVNQIFDMASSQMYRDVPVRTGYLRSTIQKSGTSGNILAKIDVSAPYAGPVNFGHHNVPPKPYATNAYYYIISQLKTIKLSEK